MTVPGSKVGRDVGSVAGDSAIWVAGLIETVVAGAGSGRDATAAAGTTGAGGVGVALTVGSVAGIAAGGGAGGAESGVACATAVVARSGASGSVEDACEIAKRQTSTPATTRASTVAGTTYRCRRRRRNISSINTSGDKALQAPRVSLRRRCGKNGRHERRGLCGLVCRAARVTSAQVAPGVPAAGL